MCIAATCGQGEFPGNSKTFWADIQDPSLPETFLSNVTFGMFGMGDSGYVFFNEVAKLIDDRMVELGANSLLPRGDGDDQDEDKWETAYEEWIPELWNEMGAPQPEMKLLEPTCKTTVDNDAAPAEGRIITRDDAYITPLQTNTPLCPDGRDIRHYEFDISAMDEVNYGAGDCLGIYPHHPVRSPSLVSVVRLIPSTEVYLGLGFHSLRFYMQKVQTF